MKKKISRKDSLEGFMMELSVLFMSRIGRNINNVMVLTVLEEKYNSPHTRAFTKLPAIISIT